MQFKTNTSSMEQALQQWRLAHNVEDGAFESLIAIISAHCSTQESSVAFNTLSPSFLGNINDGVPEQYGATSTALITSQLWQPHTDSMPFPAPKDNHQVTFLPFTVLELFLHQMPSSRNPSRVLFGAL